MGKCIWNRAVIAAVIAQSPAGYTKLKTITTRWPTGIRAGAEFVMPTM